jgi:hypothetical protein
MPQPAPQTMILKARLECAPAHEIGDEIWHEPLHEAIRYEAETTVEHIPARLLALIGFDHAVDLVVREMTAVLRRVGDSYEAIDGVIYELRDGDCIDQEPDGARLHSVPGAPVVIEVIFEDLPAGSSASRRAIAHWSDGTEDEAARWYADEVLFCEGDLIGKTREEIRALHFRRDRDWLSS